MSVHVYVYMHVVCVCECVSLPIGVNAVCDLTLECGSIKVCVFVFVSARMYVRVCVFVLVRVSFAKYWHQHCYRQFSLFDLGVRIS